MSDRVCPLNNRPCRCDTNAEDKKFHPCRITKRIGLFIGMMLGSNSDGESANAATALRRFVESEGAPVNDLTMNCDGRIEEKKYSDADAKIIFDRGVERGRTEEARKRLLAEPTEYYDADMNPKYHPMALYCQQHRQHFEPKHHDFIDKMASITVYREPTEAHGKYLLSLFMRLGSGRRQ